MKKALPFALTLLFLALFFYFVPHQSLISALRSIRPHHLLVAFFFYSLSQVVRALRWKLLLKELSLYHSFLINSANIFFNNLLPARTGELSWFYYANRLGISLKASLWSFLVGRVYDFVTLLFLFFLSLSPYRNSALALSLVLLIMAVSFCKVYFLLPSYGKLKELKIYLKKELTCWLVVQLFVLSSLSHLLKFLSLFLLLPVKDLDLYKSFLAFAGGELSTVLPFHSFMGFGTYELAFGLPLKLLGESLKEWLALGFIFHSFLLVSSFILGVPSVLLLTKSEKRYNL